MPHWTKRERDAFERAKAGSVAQLLLKAARLINEQAIGRLRERTGHDVRVAHTSVLPHIDYEGTRLTVLARRMGISKQAVGQLVTELENMGWVERVPDPEDGRAKLVRFTRRNGKMSLFEGLPVLMEFERELRDELGHDTIDRLGETLERLLAVLDE